MIDDNHLLIFTDDELFLFKIDYESWKINLMERINRCFNKIVVDQINKNNFLMYKGTEFATGSLKNDKIVLNSKREFNLYNVDFPKLNGNQLIFFRDLERKNDDGVELLEFHKIDLITLADEKYELPFCLSDNHPMPEWKIVRVLISFLS